MQDYDKEHHERLANGVASIDADTGGDSDQVRIVPVGEGDTTSGGSGKKTYWDREVLKQAVEDGAFDGAKLLKGRPGDGHKDLLEQADPDEIVGGAGEFEYRDGVGPVSESGDLLDDHIAALAERGLVELSPDMLRELGEYDEELGAYRVERIIDVPYMTILDRGASEGADISPVEAEALAEALGVAAEAVEQAREEDFEGVAEQLGSLFTLRFSAFGEMFGDEFLDEAVDNLEDIEGISASRTASNDNPELIAVIDRETVDVGTLNESVADALEDTPFEVHQDYDWVEEVAYDGLAAQIEEQVQESDESGGNPGTRSRTGVDEDPGSENQSNMTDKDIDDLREQLSEVRDKKEDLENEREELEEQLEEKEGRVEQLEDEVGDLKEDVEDVEPLKEMLADLVAEGTALDTETVAERYTTSELVEALAEDGGWDEEEGDQSPIEVVKEQLGKPPEPRGGGEADETPGGNEPDEKTEQLADEVLDANDRISIDGDESPTEYLQREYGVDVSEYTDVEQLRAAKNGERQEA